jgi:regulator of RNase E activity RraA
LRIALQTPSPGTSPPSRPLVAPATTVLFAPKSTEDSNEYPKSELPAGSHFADLAGESFATIAVISAPPNVRCAVIGGLVAARLRKRGVVGAVVDGRVRDVAEMEDWPVMARGRSTVGASAETRCVGVNVIVNVAGIAVGPGDVVFMDFAERAVVVIPFDTVDRVVSLLPRLVAVEDACSNDIDAGRALAETFREHRG